MGSFPKLCLRWNNHTANLLDTLDSLLSSQQHSDVTLACQGSVWHLHRLVLSASSTHFAGLLAEVAPGQLPLIIVDGPSKQDIAALICFIYHGEVSVDQEHLPELLKTASALKIKGLAEFPIDGPPSCHAILRSAPVQGSLDSHPSYEVVAEHHKKLKSVETSDYQSGQMTSTAHVAEPLCEEDELDDEPEEVLPLNLSCKRDSYGDSRRSNSATHNVLDDSCYEQRSILYNSNSSSVLLDVAHPEPPQTPMRIPVGAATSHIIHDHSRDSPSSSSFYKYVSISNSVPLTLESKACYVLADVAAKPDVTCSTTIPLYPPITNRPIIADQVSSSWKPSKGVIREARPLLLSDGGSNVYRVPPTYSVIMPSPSNPSASLQNQQLQEVNPSPLILPQPPMKRLRTVEPASHNIAGMKDPTEHPVSTHVSMVGISVPVPSSMSQGNSCVQPSSIYTTELNPHVRTHDATKKYQEVINVCPPQAMKSVEATHEVKVSSYENHSKASTIPCIPKYKFIPVKTETFFLSDDSCVNESSEASNRVCNTKLGCNIKQEIPMKMSSPLQTTETLKDPTSPPNPILSSAFLSTKNVAPSSMHSIVIPKSSPIKCSASPQPPLPSGSSCQVSPQVSPISSNQQHTLPPSSFNTSPQILEQKPVLKSLIESEGIAGNLASDEVPSQSAPATKTEDVEVSSIHSNTPYYASSPTCSVQTASSGTNTMSTSVTTTSSTPPASGGTATTAATSTEAATGSSSQRVSINMRTFKEEWRRQLLVDYDSRTNMSICMLCFTTFKSYDGPRKNTYVKHAKRFHTVLDDYTEEERDMIIKNYEHQYKYDPDMQKEVNKSFKCSGGGPWGGRGGGKVCRSESLPGAAAHASSGSSTGSSSQPGSRPDTDGEDEHHPQHLLGRCESPDSDGSIEVRDTISVGPPSGGGDAAASTTSTVGTGPMVSVTGGTAAGSSQLSSMVITSHGTTHTSSSVDRLHPGSSASVFSIAGPSLTVMAKAPVYEGSTIVAPQSLAPLSTSSVHASTGNLTVSGHSSLLTTSVHSTSTCSSHATIPSSSSTLVFTNLVPGSSSATRPSYLFTTQGAPLSAYPVSTPRPPFSNELKYSPSNNNNISTNNKNNCSSSTTEKVEARPRNKFYPSQSFVHTTSSPTVSLARSGGTSVPSTVVCGAMGRSNAAVSVEPTNTSASSAVVVGTLSNTPQRSTAATCPSSSSAVSPGDSTISVTVPAV